MAEHGGGERQAAIRAACLQDAAAIAAIHVRSWRRAYAAFFPADVLARLDPSVHAHHWLRVLGERPLDTAVCEMPGGLAGFIHLQAEETAAGPGARGEIVSLYLDPEQWRKGHGRRLVRWACSEAGRRHWDGLTVWILRDNLPARRFYESLGFGCDHRFKHGSLKERFGGVDSPSVELERLSVRLQP